MIWKACILQAKSQTGVDALGNPTYRWITAAETHARETPFDNEHITGDRRFTKDMQSFVLRLRELPDCERAVIDSVPYEITEVIDLYPRYAVIRVRVDKQ